MTTQRQHDTTISVSIEGHEVDIFEKLIGYTLTKIEKTDCDGKFYSELIFVKIHSEGEKK